MSRVQAAVGTCLVTAVAVLTGACGLGAKQALADQVVTAAKRVERAGDVRGTIAVDVSLVKSGKPLVPGPPRILPARLLAQAAILDPRNGNATVGGNGVDPGTAAVVFLGPAMYQRIPSKQVTTGIKIPGSAATNLVAILAAGSTQLIAIGSSGPNPDAVPLDTTTTTTAAPSALRRQARIVRQWIAFDYGQIKDKDSTKQAGSYAINPTVLLKLAGGVLTGSIKRGGTETVGGTEATRYDANVSRDKAERRLPESKRKLLDKIFTANAVSARVLKAHIWVDGHGDMRRFSVTLRQGLTNIDRADLTVTIAITNVGGGHIAIDQPDPKATAVVTSLGQLVTKVAGA